MPKSKKDTLIEKVARKLREIYYGESTYGPPLPKPKKKKKKEFRTVRTLDVTRKLKHGGLTEKEIRRLRGKGVKK